MMRWYWRINIIWISLTFSIKSRLIVCYALCFSLMSVRLYASVFSKPRHKTPFCCFLGFQITMIRPNAAKTQGSPFAIMSPTRVTKQQRRLHPQQKRHRKSTIRLPLIYTIVIFIMLTMGMISIYRYVQQT